METKKLKARRTRKFFSKLDQIFFMEKKMNTALKMLKDQLETDSHFN